MSDLVFVSSRNEEFIRQIDDLSRLEGADILPMGSLQEAYTALESQIPLILLIDRRGEDPNLLGLIRKIHRKYRDLELILLESPRSDAVHEAERKAGIDRVLQLPLSSQDLKLLLGRRIRLRRLRKQCRMVGRSETLEQIHEMILQIAPTDVSVLVTGESGTGKELIAQTVHRFSRRSEEPFLALNCGALPEGTLESELFGHEKGAFTGASGAHAGYFERADGGTLFLDEIGELSAGVQIRLLRVLETGEFFRMGAVKPRRADVRIVAATNRELDLEVREGRFRRDLLHRIKVFEIRLPALRDRREDIPLLIEHFIRETAEKENTPVFAVDRPLMDVLCDARWPGNVRELRNTVQRMAIMARGKRLGLDDLPDDFARAPEQDRNLPQPLNLQPADAERELLYRSILSLRNDMKEALDILRDFQERMPGDEDLPEMSGGLQGRDLSRERDMSSIEDMERDLIQRTLDEHGGHRKQAARQLGISERTLYRKIKEYGLAD